MQLTDMVEADRNGLVYLVDWSLAISHLPCSKPVTKPRVRDPSRLNRMVAGTHAILGITFPADASSKYLPAPRVIKRLAVIELDSVPRHGERRVGGGGRTTVQVASHDASGCQWPAWVPVRTTKIRTNMCTPDQMEIQIFNLEAMYHK